MKELDNKFKNDPRYICKNDINKISMSKMGLNGFRVGDVKNAFENCSYKTGMTGNPLNEKQQRHTKYVLKQELYKRTVKY